MKDSYHNASRYFKCFCDRCQDPSELGSHLSTLKCPKCESDSGFMMQQNPTQEDSPWRCNIHNFVYTKQNVDSFVSDLRAHFFKTVRVHFKLSQKSLIQVLLLGYELLNC